MQIMTSRLASGTDIVSGVAQLDKLAPQWWTTLDLDRLDLTVQADSPLGQALGPARTSYYLGRRHNYAWAVIDRLYVGAETTLSEDELCALEDQWRTAVAERRALVGGGW